MEEALLNFLILNAGVCGVSGRTSEGFEMGVKAPGARVALPPAAAQNGSSSCPHEPSDTSLVVVASLRVCRHSAPEHLNIVLRVGRAPPLKADQRAVC
jgi:hypothetical protein